MVSCKPSLRQNQNNFFTRSFKFYTSDYDSDSNKIWDGIRTLFSLTSSLSSGRGYSWEFLVGVCHVVLQFLTLFQTEKCHFLHLFSDPALNIMSLLHRLDSNKKRFVKIHYKFAFFSFFLTHLELKKEICSYAPIFPRNWYLIPEQNGKGLYLFSEQNSAKPLPFGVAHVYVAYIREYPPPWLSSMLLIMAQTLTPSLVKTSLKWASIIDLFPLSK